ncbi:MAG: zinc-binding dehydrogenase [Nocardioidaceae bacterium]|nr:zinc-binding dehydrogenase [Nocardioidaceae bacterium]
MRAARIHQFGGPEVIRIDEVEPPRPGRGQVVIDVTASVLGHLDADVLRGVSRLDVPLPHTLGFEAVGRISALGEGVTGWQLGDRVLPAIHNTCGRCGFCRSGRDSLCGDRQFMGKAFADKMLCSADHLTRLDSLVGGDLPDEQVIAVPTSFGTAWHMLFTRGRLAVGETVLVSSVGSGIGSAAVQLAKLAGARVIGTASTDEKLDRAADLGMDVGINYTRQDVVAEVMAATGGRGADLTYEHVGGEAFQHGLEALGVDGRLVTCGAHAGEVVDFDIIPFFRKQLAVIGSYGYTKVEVTRCMELAARGDIRPVVHQVLPLDEVGKAMTMMERREQFGRIVLVP